MSNTLDCKLAIANTRPKIAKSKHIDRIRKNKRILRSSKTQFYGYCIDNIQLG